MFYKSSGCTPLLLRSKILSKQGKFFLLDNINLTLKKNSIVIIKGKNGSGKTTLILLIQKIINFNLDYFKKIDKLFFISNYLNSFNINLIQFKYLLQIHTNLDKLSLGFTKYFNFLLNYFIIKNMWVFDEPFNGLDKHLVTRTTHQLKLIRLINGRAISAYHNIRPLKGVTLLFLN